MRRLLALATLTLCAAQVALANPAPSAASIERLLAITEARKMNEAALGQAQAMMKPMLDRALAQQQLSVEQRRQAEAAMGQFTQRMHAVLAEELSWDRLKGMQVQIYASTFSQQEIDGLIAFYESPVGRVFVEKMPVVLQKSMLAMQERMVPMMQKIAQAAQEMARELKEGTPQR